LTLLASTAVAQEINDAPDPAKTRLRIGALYLNPTIALTNVGVDDNVFNDPSASGPKQDVTITLTPSTDLWLRIGPSWVTGNIKEDINWYRDYASERSANTTYTLGWRIPLSRVAFKLGTVFSNSRERPGFEIDARAARKQLEFTGAAEYRALSRTYLGAAGSRERVQFSEQATFLGTNLHDQLNHVSSSYSVTVREQVTAMTAVTFAGTHSEDRFEFSPDRDSSSNAATVAVAFDPQALLKGTATIGYTDFKPYDSTLPAFRGVTTNVNLSYTLLEMTKFTLVAHRAVQNSFEINQPYYVQTGYTFTVAQQIFGPVDIVVRLGHQTLAYRDREGMSIASPNRSDEVSIYGGGIGYHLGKSLRLGINVDQTRRTSPLESRRYEGLRYGAALTIGT
jgi:hypothetical protein